MALLVGTVCSDLQTVPELEIRRQLSRKASSPLHAST